MKNNLALQDSNSGFPLASGKCTIIFQNMTDIPLAEHLKQVTGVSIEFTSADKNKPHGTLTRLSTGNSEILTSCSFPELIEHLYNIHGAENAENIPVKATSRNSRAQLFDGTLGGLVDIYEAYPKHPQTLETATPVQS
jgi:hypothetical protein